jgi:hypothetical protein
MDTCIEGTAVCVSGTTGVASTSAPYLCNGVGFGINVDQASGSAMAGTYSVPTTSTGITYALSSFPAPPGGSVRIQVVTGTGTGSTYCATIAAATGTVAWTSLEENCYGTPPGAALAGPPTDLQDVQFTIEDGTAMYHYDVCLDSITF